MEYDKSIYKKDTKGKIRFLNVLSKNGQVIQLSGILGTDNPMEHISDAKPKNIGKSNETTAQEQAYSEAKAKIENKMSQGYFETREEALSEVVILPMLAKSYGKEKSKIKFPCFIQPKLDGMRCLIMIKNGKASLISRTGKEITTMEHIRKDAEDLHIENIVLDGELYVHGESFQENMKLVKKYRPGKSEKIQFRCYDLVMTEHSFSNRDNFIVEILANSDAIHISGVETKTVQNEDEIVQYHKDFIAEGYEGSMIRWGDEGYKIKGRSSNLLKNKDFIDKAYTVVDVEPSDKIPSHGVVICENEAGRFGCGMKFSHEDREEILANKSDYIGKKAEIRFFEFTDSGLPRFPVCVGFRLDK